jgi:hypothetical protein
MKIVFGALILINAYLWPQWTGIDGWIKFFGVLLVIAGIIRAIKPSCDCKEHTEVAAPAKRKR